MKKMMMMAAALFIAVAAQALTVDWGVDWGYSYDASRPSPAFDQGLYDSGTSGGTYWLIALGGSSDVSGISVDNLGNLVGATAMETGAFAATYGGSINGLTAADNGTYYAMVVFDSTTLNWGIAVAQISGISDAPPMNGDFMFFSNLGQENGYWSMAANTATVPEPTSMALLALGAASFGLRRKFRK